MSDSKTWTDEWLKAQQKFVKSWSDMAKSGDSKKQSSTADLWADGFNLWRKKYPSPCGEADQVIDKCMDIGRGYFSMAEQIGSRISAGGKPQDVIDQILEQLKTILQKQADSLSPLQQQAPDLMSQWAAPSASWQKMVMAMMPVQFAEPVPGIYGIGEDFDQLSQILSAPGTGFSREYQQKHQQGIKLALEYFQANHQFNLALLKTSIASLQSFKHKLTTSSGKDTKSPGSLRALYDLWVETSESHYTEFAMSKEYQSLYGDMVNKLMALKKHYSDVVDDYLQSMNLPSRRELDILEQRVHQLRRDNHSLKREIKEIRALLNGQKSSVKSATRAKTKKSTRRAGAKQADKKA